MPSSEVARISHLKCTNLTQPHANNLARVDGMSKEQRRLRGSTKLGCYDDQDDDEHDDGVFAKRRTWGPWCVTRAAPACAVVIAYCGMAELGKAQVDQTCG